MADRVPQQLFSTHEALSSIGRYGLRKLLGTGASGSVYAAFDPESNQDVAVNLMLVSPAAGPNALSELRAVAEAWADIDNPFLVRMHEVGTYVDPRERRRQGVYVVRDLVSGMDMQRWLDALTRPIAMSWSQLLGMFIDGGSALASAHAKGLVHGGFSPASILVGYDGGIRVGDFTSVLAKPMGDADQFTTIAYASPEVQAGGRPDALADQFSFCATVWSSLQRVVQGKMPRRVSAVLARGMAENPADRWGSMELLLAALDKARGGLLRRTLGAFSATRPTALSL